MEISGAASEVTPEFVSPSDPAAQWTPRPSQGSVFAYAHKYLVDAWARPRRRPGDAEATFRSNGPVIEIVPCITTRR
jgi:hypothetical protein